MPLHRRPAILNRHSNTSFKVPASSSNIHICCDPFAAVLTRWRYCASSANNNSQLQLRRRRRHANSETSSSSANETTDIPDLKGLREREKCRQPVADFQLDFNRNSKHFYSEVIREQRQTKITARMLLIHLYRHGELNCAHRRHQHQAGSECCVKVDCVFDSCTNLSTKKSSRQSICLRR